MSILDIPARLLALGRKVEELLALQSKTRESLEFVDRRLRAVEDRLIRLEANHGQVIAEAKAAAGAASTAVATAIMSDVITRVTRIEMRADNLGKLPSSPSSS